MVGSAHPTMRIGFVSTEVVVAQAVLAVVSVLGKDQKGVVAQFATYMADRGINIEDIEQRVVRGFFVMDMLVDLKDLTVDLSEIRSEERRVGKECRERGAGDREKKKKKMMKG